MEKTNMMVELLIKGDNFQAEFITKRLNLKPSKCFSRGDAIGGKDTKREFSLWQISTGYEESRDIEKQLSKIFNLMKDKVVQLNEIKNEFNPTIVVGIVASIYDNETPSIFFDRWFINFLNSIHAVIDIDLYID